MDIIELNQSTDIDFASEIIDSFDFSKEKTQHILKKYRD